MPARRSTICLVAGIALWVVPATAFCQGAKVREWVGLLASENFREREEAQLQLTTWALSEPSRALELLFSEYEATAEPEAKLRLREPLRELVVADHQKNHGRGFVGVGMRELLNVAIPGDNLARTGVLVTEVKEKSPADRAGLKLGDVIVSLEGLRWVGTGAPEAFSTVVKKCKPGEKVKLEILRNGELSKVTVQLEARPLGMSDVTPRMLWENGMFIAPPDPVEGEEKAREEVLRTWLEEKRASRKLP